MHRILLAVAWLTYVCFAIANEPKPETKKVTVAKALEMFSGTWEIISVHPDGATKEARQLVFRQDGTYAAQDKQRNELWAGTFEIDPTMSPNVWDHRSQSAKQEGKDVLGIYDLNGDKLKVACVVGQWKEKKWVGKTRPTGFSLDVADVVIELKRVNR